MRERTGSTLSTDRALSNVKLARSSTPSLAPTPAPTTPRSRTVRGGGRAAVAFISGLVGLLVANLLLGPLAIGLGVSALRRRDGSRGRAILAIALGIADLAVFAALAVHSALGHGAIWHFGSF